MYCCKLSRSVSRGSGCPRTPDRRWPPEPGVVVGEESGRGDNDWRLARSSRWNLIPLSRLAHEAAGAATARTARAGDGTRDIGIVSVLLAARVVDGQRGDDAGGAGVV